MRRAVRLLAVLFLSVPLLAVPNGEPRVRPCVTEDSAGPCFWDAHTRGNGSGVSFLIDAHQTIHYLR